MAVEAHTMCLLLLITWKREFFIKMVILQTVLTAVRLVEANGAKSFFCMLNKMSKLNGHKYLQKANSSVLQEATLFEISVAST